MASNWNENAITKFNRSDYNLGWVTENRKFRFFRKLIVRYVSQLETWTIYNLFSACLSISFSFALIHLKLTFRDFCEITISNQIFSSTAAINRCSDFLGIYNICWHLCLSLVRIWMRNVTCKINWIYIWFVCEQQMFVVLV